MRFAPSLFATKQTREKRFGQIVESKKGSEFVALGNE
jgi:hypothetical protein